MSIKSGNILAKPTRADRTQTTFETELLDTFFIGQHHPIDYAPEFRKHLKREYDRAETKVEIDLNAGADKLNDKPGTLSFDLLLDYLVDQRRITGKDLFEIVHGAKIVCRRGVLNKLVNCPYNTRSEFSFAVKRFRGIYFIKETAATYDRQNAQHPGGNHFLYLPKFKERIILPFGDDDAYEAPPKDVVSTWEQMQGLYLSELVSCDSDKQLRIFYGTEMDALDKNQIPIEIKLQSGHTLPKGTAPPSLADKMRKWYFQTELVGGDTVVVGFHTHGVVTSTKKIKIDDLPAVVKEEDKWSSYTSYSSVLNILSEVIGKYRKHVRKTETMIVDLRPPAPNVTFQIYADDVHNILPQNFKDAFEDDMKFVKESGEPVTTDYVLETKKEWYEDVFRKVYIP